MENLKILKLLEVLNGWVGRDYNPGVPAQCAAFTRAAWKESGIDLPTAEAPDDGLDTGPNMANSFAGNEIGPKVEVRDIRPGDILLFKNTYGNFPPGTITHVGTCIGSNMMVDRPTMSRPVQKRSIFSFGVEGIAQIRRPTYLYDGQFVAKNNIPSILLDEDNKQTKIFCNPQVIDNKIRVDLRGVCNSLGFMISYDQDKNVATIRRK
jgi:NlpC/P60 family